ncbi:hypothetical protein V6N13_116639 [Hibiscus sabdariffa]
MAVVSCAVVVAENRLLGDYSLSLLNPRFGFFGRRSWTVQGPGSWFSGAVWLSFTVVHWMQIIWDLDTAVFWVVVHYRNLMSTAVFWAVAHCRNLMSYPLLWWKSWLLRDGTPFIQPAQYYNWILLPRRPCCSRQRRLLLWLPAPFLFVFSFSYPCALLSDPLNCFHLWQVLRRCDFWVARCLYGHMRRVTSIPDFLERTPVVKTNSRIRMVNRMVSGSVAGSGSTSGSDPSCYLSGSAPTQTLWASWSVSSQAHLILSQPLVCGVSLVWPPSASTACGFLHTISASTACDVLHTIAILHSCSSYMGSDLLSAMENPKFTEEEAAVITEIPAEDEDSNFWLVGSVISLKPVDGDSVIRFAIWKLASGVNATAPPAKTI